MSIPGRGPRAAGKIGQAADSTPGGDGHHDAAGPAGHLGGDVQQAGRAYQHGRHLIVTQPDPHQVAALAPAAGQQRRPPGGVREGQPLGVPRGRGAQGLVAEQRLPALPPGRRDHPRGRPLGLRHVHRCRSYRRRPPPVCTSCAAATPRRVSNKVRRPAASPRSNSITRRASLGKRAADEAGRLEGRRQCGGQHDVPGRIVVHPDTVTNGPFGGYTAGADLRETCAGETTRLPGGTGRHAACRLRGPAPEASRRPDRHRQPQRGLLRARDGAGPGHRPGPAEHRRERAGHRRVGGERAAGRRRAGPRSGSPRRTCCVAGGVPARRRWSRWPGCTTTCCTWSSVPAGRSVRSKILKAGRCRSAPRARAR